MATPSAQDRARLQQHFERMPVDQHTGGWDELWQESFTPWDRSGPSLALKDAVTGHAEIFGNSKREDGQRKKAFVPGCGRGYDVLLLASLGYDAYGLDASQNALDAARKMTATAWTSDQTYAAHDASVGRGETKFLYGDFFTNDFFRETNGGDFDLIYDYTFLCALPPELRPRWAKRMSELLGTQGHLVCLQFPVGKDPKAGGPPFGLTSELYEQLFVRPGDEVQYAETGLVVADSSVQKSDGALERVALFKPERTHEAGKDTDLVSIWKHWKA